MSEATYEGDVIRMHRQAQTWLVTGAAGFIGSHIVQRLLELEQRVVALDNFSTGSRRNLDEIRSVVGPDVWQNLEFIEGSIVDPETCERACRDADIVLHQAALGSVPRSLKDPANTHTNNATGQLNMLVAAHRAGVKRFVFASSSSVYGDDRSLPKVESRIGAPLSPYAVSKYANELYASVVARQFGLETIGLRYFNVFGPRQDPHGAYAAVIPRWIAALMSGGPCQIFGDGSTSRDFCYVENVVRANLRAGLTTRPEALNQIFNVSLGGCITLTDLFLLIRSLVAARVPSTPGIADINAEYVGFRNGDIAHSRADVTKVRSLLEFVAAVDVETGMRATVDWYASAFELAGSS